MEESEKRRGRLQAEAGPSPSPRSPYLSSPLVHPAPAPAAGSTLPVPRFDIYADSMLAFSDSKRSSVGFNPPENFSSPIRSASPMSQPSSNRPSGLANCYVFKSRLQEYAQKVNISTPVYQTLKEGPSHEPVFKSTVIVNDAKYDSLPGFLNRKAAEQSAAEVALIELHESGHMTEHIPTVVGVPTSNTRALIRLLLEAFRHETGLCKNLLQEYAQKMNYAIPSYSCRKQPSGLNPFSCTVEIGGIQYIGAAARTKKEAEIKAARTALLAIQRGSETSSDGASRYSVHTVLPGKKRATETQTEAVKQLKPKKASFKKKWQKKRFPRNKDDRGLRSNKDEVGIGKDEDTNKDHQGDQQPEGSTLCDNEPVSGKVKDEPEAQVCDTTMSATEANGYRRDAGQQEGSAFSCTGQGSYAADGSTTLRACDDQSRDAKGMDTAFTQKGIEISVAGEMFEVKSEE